jgi:DNA-binding response OmpR family regulator
VRLVRELLAADADSAMASADVAVRAARYLEVVTSGLGVRAGAILVRERSGELGRTATSLSSAANALLADQSGRGATLARRACEEGRAFLAHRGTDDLLMRAVHEADPAAETIAILPLVDHHPIGVLVLAGDERTLAADVVRTLQPALRLLALLVSPSRDLATSDAVGRRVEQLVAERDAHAQTILVLEAQVVELEAALAAARAAAGKPEGVPVMVLPPELEPVDEAPAPAPVVEVRAPEAVAPPPPVVVEPETTSTVVVVDAAGEWERYAVNDHKIVVVAPGADVVALVRAERPGRIIVNIAAPGGLALVAALRAEGVRTPIFGVAAEGAHPRVVGLGIVDAVTHPLSSDALAAAVERTAPRGARVFAAGRDAEALMKMRQRLAKQGLSVSLARDTKQIDELVAMVRPQVVVIDLELPVRQGYELVMRMAATSPAPALVLIVPDGDPSPLLVEKLRERVAAGLGVGAKQWLVEVIQQKIVVRPVARTTAAAVAAR